MSINRFDIIKNIIDTGDDLGIRFSDVLSAYVVSGTSETFDDFDAALSARLLVLLKEMNDQDEVEAE